MTIGQPRLGREEKEEEEEERERERRERDGDEIEIKIEIDAVENLQIKQKGKLDSIGVNKRGVAEIVVRKIATV